MKILHIHSSISCISMCVDGINTMASASPSGNVAVWDLDNRRLGAVIRDAHYGAVTGMQVCSSHLSFFPFKLLPLEHNILFVDTLFIYCM